MRRRRAVGGTAAALVLGTLSWWWGSGDGVRHAEPNAEDLRQGRAVVPERDERETESSGSAAFPGDPARTEIPGSSGRDRLLGTVTRADDGRPIAGAVIVVRPFIELGELDDATFLNTLRARGLRDTGEDESENEEPLARTTTDGRGKFTFDTTGWARGDYTVTASTTGRVPERQRWSWTAGLDQIDFRLRAGRSLTGIVRSRDERGLGDVSIELYRRKRSTNLEREFQPLHELQWRLFATPFARTRSRPDGTFSFEGLVEGPCTLLLERAGYQLSEEPVVILENEATTIDLTMLPSATISGLVTYEDGDPAMGAIVAVGRGEARRSAAADRTIDAMRSRMESLREEGRFDDADAAAKRLRAIEAAEDRREVVRERLPVAITDAYGVARTDGDGRFLIDGLGRGSYALSVEGSDFLARRLDDVALEPGDRRVDIVVSRGLRVEGRVISSPGGDPVADATLTFRRGGAELRTLATDTAGSFVIDGLARGDRWDVEARAAGFGRLRLEEIEPSAASSTPLVLVLRPSARISGRAVDETGASVGGVRVEARPARSMIDDVHAVAARASSRRGSLDGWHDRTGVAGRFDITELPADVELELAVESIDYLTFRTQPFRLEPGESLSDLVIELERGAGAIVVLRDSEGRPLAGARLALRRQLGESVSKESRADHVLWARLDRDRFRTRSGDDGVARWWGLDDGTYTLSANARGFQPLETSVTLSAGERPSELSLTLLPSNSLRGIVVGPDGATVPRAQIRARASHPAPHSGRRHEASARSDARGAFVLDELGSGPYDLEIGAGSRFARRHYGEVAIGEELVVELEWAGASP